jgi:citrate synthase
MTTGLSTIPLLIKLYQSTHLAGYTYGKWHENRKDSYEELSNKYTQQSITYRDELKERLQELEQDRDKMKEGIATLHKILKSEHDAIETTRTGLQLAHWLMAGEYWKVTEWYEAQQEKE